MVLVFSSRANQSKQIHREVQCAFDKGVSVIPLRIENVAPLDSLAFYLGPVHWLDALTKPLEGHLEKLSQSVIALLHAGGWVPGAPKASTPRGATVTRLIWPKSRTGRAVRLCMLVALVVVIGAIAVVFPRANTVSKASQWGTQRCGWGLPTADGCCLEVKPEGDTIKRCPYK
jgi:hypothetical protein